ESAILLTLQPGSYTVIESGKNGTSGVGLIELYDVDAGANSHLSNISTRGVVQTGANVMIGGFIVSGANGSVNLIVRALGPSLAKFGVPSPLADPRLGLRALLSAMCEYGLTRCWLDVVEFLSADGLAEQSMLTFYRLVRKTT